MAELTPTLDRMGTLQGIRLKAQEKFQGNQGNATIFKETKIVEEVIYDYGFFDYIPA